MALDNLVEKMMGLVSILSNTHLISKWYVKSIFRNIWAYLFSEHRKAVLVFMGKALYKTTCLGCELAELIPYFIKKKS